MYELESLGKIASVCCKFFRLGYLTVYIPLCRYWFFPGESYLIRTPLLFMREIGLLLTDSRDSLSRTWNPVTTQEALIDWLHIVD